MERRSFLKVFTLVPAVAAGAPLRPSENPAAPGPVFLTDGERAFLDAALSRLQLSQLAQAASAAIHHRITPAGTSADGDMIFALGPLDGPAPNVFQAEALAVEALEAAIENAVRFAVGRDGIPGCADAANGASR